MLTFYNDNKIAKSTNQSKKMKLLQDWTIIQVMTLKDKFQNESQLSHQIDERTTVNKNCELVFDKRWD